MPTPNRGSPAPQPFDPASVFGGTDPGMPAELQQEFIRALMGSGALGTTPPSTQTQPQRIAPMNHQMPDFSDPGMMPPSDDPMAAMMQALMSGQAPQMGSMGAMGGPSPLFPGQQEVQTRPKSLLQKILPLIHLFSTWILLAFFVFFKEPEEYREGLNSSGNLSLWQRWGDLSWREAKAGLGVQVVVSNIFY